MLTTIFLYRYGGSAGSQANKFDLFSSILTSKAKAIPGLFSALKEASYLSKLTIVIKDEKAPSNLDESRAILANDHALQFFEGIIDEESDHNYWVTSTAFYGALLSTPQRESIKLRMLISAKEYDSLKDTHTLAILYALYLDALRSGGSRELQAAFLEQSRRLVEQLKRYGDLDDDIKTVGAAITAALDASGRS